MTTKKDTVKHGQDSSKILVSKVLMAALVVAAVGIGFLLGVLYCCQSDSHHHDHPSMSEMDHSY
jgi:hypothetical protein